MHDADSHIYEEANWLQSHVDAATNAAVPRLWETHDESSTVGSDIAHARARHEDPAFRADDASQLMLRKNLDAVGSFINTDRPGPWICWGSRRSSCSTHSPRRRRSSSAHGDPRLGVRLAEGQRRAMTRVVRGGRTFAAGRGGAAR